MNSMGIKRRQEALGEHKAGIDRAIGQLEAQLDTR
jgi:hypothetical protein